MKWINLADQKPPQGPMLIVASTKWASPAFAKWDGDAFREEVERIFYPPPTHWMLAPVLEENDG